MPLGEMMTDQKDVLVTGGRRKGAQEINTDRWEWKTELPCLYAMNMFLRGTVAFLRNKATGNDYFNVAFCNRANGNGSVLFLESSWRLDGHLCGQSRESGGCVGLMRMGRLVERSFDGFEIFMLRAENAVTDCQLIKKFSHLPNIAMETL